MNISRKLITTSVFGLVAASIAAPAMAQTDESSVGAAEIVVTAQRRAEASVDVPISVTTLSGDQLATANVEELGDISKITPSLRFDYTGAFVQPTIRGIGTGVTTSGGGANVGIYVDGFYSANPQAASFQLTKVDSIQVLKGPQGTLFGRNTTGGAILVQTAEPSTDTSAEVKASYGRYNEARLQGYATFGVSEKVAIDIEGLYRRGDGWVRDIATGSKDAGDYQGWSVRVGLKAELSDSVSVLLRYQHTNSDDPTNHLSNAYVDADLGTGIASFAPPSSYTVDPDEFVAGKDKRFLRLNTDIVQGTIKADLGVADLTSYSQYRKDESNSSADLDRTGLTIFQLGLPVSNETWSQEFLLTSKPGSRLQWTAGLFYFSNQDTYTTFLDNNIATVGRVRLGGSSTTTRTYAAFVDATYELSTRLFLTAGARYAHDSVTNAYFNPVGTNGARQYVPDLNADKVTPRFVLRYKPTENSSLYASYTKGYKAGIIDVGGATGNRVKPENIDAFELGFKYSDRRFSFEGAAFYYDYNNLQVSLFKDATAQIVNAASSEIYGLEGQFRYTLARGFTINAGASWTHARYKEFANAPIYRRCPSVNQPAPCTAGLFYIQGVNLSNVPMQRTPEFTGNIGANYMTDVGGGELSLTGNFYYTSKFFHGPSGTQFQQDGYEVLSLRADWTDPTSHYTVGIWGDNVTNSRYYTAIQFGNFGIGSNWSKPVTYGVDLRLKF